LQPDIQIALHRPFLNSNSNSNFNSKSNSKSNSNSNSNSNPNSMVRDSRVIHSFFSEIQENAVPFVAGNFRKFKSEFFIEWKVPEKNTSSFWIGFRAQTTLKYKQGSHFLHFCRLILGFSSLPAVL